MPSNISFLFPECRKRVLSLLLLHPDTRYYVREIAKLTDIAPGTIHRELTKLANAEVLSQETEGNQVYFQANRQNIIFEELVSILKKTSGIVDVLSRAIKPLKKRIKLAFVFGSIARGTENTRSDVDLMIVGNISYNEAVAALYKTQDTLKREINPKIYSVAEWRKLQNKNDFFIQGILKQTKLFVIGNKDDV